MRRHEADRKRKIQKQAPTRGAYRVANQQSSAVRRALEWIRMSKARLVFRYEMSDLFLRNHPFSELTSDITTSSNNYEVFLHLGTIAMESVQHKHDSLY